MTRQQLSTRQRVRCLICALCFAGLQGWHSGASADPLTPTNLFLTRANAVYINSATASPSNIDNAFLALTNGVVHYPTTNLDKVDTFSSDLHAIVPDFVGLRYSSPQTFDELTIDLARQFADGGSWEALPKLYILDNPMPLVGRETAPDFLPGIWREVTGHVETTGYTFNPLSAVAEGQRLTFDLSAIPAADRSGWGWALSGDGTANASGVQNFISLTEVAAAGTPAAAAPPVSLPAAPQAVNIVSNAYHFPRVTVGGVTDLISDGRGTAFQVATNGIVDYASPDPTPNLNRDGFDTFQSASGDVSTATDFVGLQYSTLVEFDSITIHLGRQFADGGDWQELPRIFILKNPVDTGSTRPETDPTNWVEITGFAETTGHIFDPTAVQGSGSMLNFDLSAVHAAERTGWGWAVGGVRGTVNAAGSGADFISVSEISATGSVVPEPGSLALVCGSLVALGYWQRKRR